MSSLQGAPSLGRGPARPFTYNMDWDEDEDDDDYIPEVAETTKTSGKPAEKEKDKKKDKKKPHKERKSSDREDPTRSGKEKDKIRGKQGRDPSPKPTAKSNSEDSYNYEDDFVEDEEEVLDSDDYIPPVTSTPPPPAVQRHSPASTKSAGFADSRSDSGNEKHAVEELEERLRQERVQHEKKLREWEEAQAEKERESRRRQAELQREVEALKKQQPTEEDVRMQVETLLAEKLAAMQREGQSKKVEQHSAAGTATAYGEGGNADELSDEAADNAKATGAPGEQRHQQRRRQRERERALQLRRLHEEEAARSLFQRLAQDVREVFHELNLSVVAAEKERLIKDERYRKEREARERREEMEREEKLQKESKERAEREEKFWASMEEREEKLRQYTEQRLRKDEEERESRLKRDLEDRTTRAQNEREMREQLERLETERRAKQASEERQRDNLVLEAQLNEVRAQYTQQVEEVKRQNDLAREHSEELHRVELQMMEKRHEAAIEKMLHHNSQQMAATENHAANTAKLEKLIERMHEEMEATKKMNEKLTQERLSVLQAKENQLEEQHAVLDAVMGDLRDYKSDLEKERTRIAGLYTKFDLSLSTFVKNAEEDRRRLQEAQAHYNTLRQQAERDRKLMLSEIAQERKVLEQQQEELLARKMETMNEIQIERAVLSRERTEAAVARERQNRDEGELLRSLREREEEYSAKLEALEADRVSMATMKAEQREVLARAVAERDALRREREAFEMEKEQLLSRFEEVRRRAEDAAMSQDRMRKVLVDDRASREFGIASADARGHGAAHSDPTASALPASIASKLQMDLARQRAVLQKITS